MKQLREFLKLMRGSGQAYAVAFVLLVMATGLFLLLPQKFGELIEVMSVPGGQIDMQDLRRVGIQIAVLAMAQAILAAGYTYVINRTAEQIGNDLRKRFFRNLISQPWASSSGEFAGGTATQFVSDLAILQAGLGDTLLSFFRHLFFTIGALTLMFAINAEMASITLASAAAVALVCTVFILMANRVMARMQIERANVVSLLVEAMANKYAIQAFGVGPYFEERFADRVRTSFRVIAKYLSITALINPVALLVFTVASFVVVLFGVNQIIDGALGVGDLISFLSYVLILVAAIVQAGITGGQLQLAAAMREKHELLLLPASTETHEVSASTARSTVARAKGETPPPGFVLNAVEFTYPSSTTSALRGASFSIPAGKTTALFGTSGAGKSTIAGIMLGLVSPDTGEVRMTDVQGDTNIARRIAVVPQNPFLFSGTIEENIVFGRSGVDQNDVRRAARMAHIHEHIQSLRDGYDHWIDEGGQNLSRGQQQRIALARALVAHPKVLILDEATASLDVASERAIKVALSQLSGSTTILIIAHQGALLTDIDHLVVLEAGKVVYEGPPNGAHFTGDSMPPQLALSVGSASS